MAKIERFEDLECWQQSRVLVKRILTSLNNDKKSIDYDTKSQLRRAALSIMNNIAEGFARYSDKEFIRFLEYSQSSSAEVKSMIYLFEDMAYLPQEELNALHNQLDKTRKMILGLIRYLRNKNTKAH